MPRNYIPNIVENAQGANTQFNRVLDLLKSKRAENGMSNREISLITEIPPRRVREVTQRMKMHYGLKDDKQCPCGRTPMLYFP
tara:strand:- start:15 stop:263 length:249 start_codon:yes stop_codon:yes gene_type:complete